ncbi:unnamed protein product [Symbiodinium necroappetens]|uniref:Uncharacterized protein n=1 Tax=Symbiodinium necroappetens TaxID=1628268 RepID=A0A812PPH9_9DINO|nr:unnamed protein product [Symbiodinium necroappetens]
MIQKQIGGTSPGQRKPCWAWSYWISRLVLASILFLIAVDINPEVDDSPRRRRRLIAATRVLSPAIQGSNWWTSCGLHMHTCSGPWLPQMKEYCCCDSGYTWAADACDLETTTTLPVPDAEDSSGRSTLLFCETFDQEESEGSLTYEEMLRLNETSVQEWVAGVLAEAGYERSLPEVTRILQKHHVDGEALPTLTSWSLMTYGMDQGPSQAISGRVQSLKISPRRLSSGTSGCSDDDGDTSIHTGSSGCTEDEQEQHRSLHTGSQGCSKSSTGTRGCHHRHASGAQGCHHAHYAAKGCDSGARGCHHAHHAAKGCDSGVQGCHSGVCGCQDRSGLGDTFGFVMLLPFIMIVVIGIMVHALAALPILMLYPVAFPVILAMVSFTTGSFLALLCAGLSAIAWTAWTGSIVWLRSARAEADGILLDVTSGED